MNSLIFIYIFVGALLLISYLKNPVKTYLVLKISTKDFIKFSPIFLEFIILVSIVLYFVPPEMMTFYLNRNSIFESLIIAALLGSLIFAPAFIVFPLSAILIKCGVKYTVISLFTSTLMMVGVLTFPIEKKYFGLRIAVIRNLLSLVISIIISIIIGLFYAEFR